MRVIGEYESSPDIYKSVISDDAVKTVVGIGVIVVLNDFAGLNDEDLKILTVEELTDKPETGKVKGRRGIIQETVRVADMKKGIPELPEETLIGAMEEILSPDRLQDEGPHFSRTIFPRRPEIPLLTLPGNKWGGLEVVVFDGTEIVAADEVVRPRFVSAKEFLADQSGRPTSRELVQYAVKEGLLSKSIAQHRRGLTAPVFGRNFPFSKFLQMRNSRPDITDTMKSLS